MKERKDKMKSEKKALAKLKENKEVNIVETQCKDRDCPFHGELSVRGRTFEGRVIKKFSKRAVIVFERMIYVRKYERYAKSRTKIHARLSTCMEKNIEIGDLIQVRECRPLSKITHFVVIKKIKSKEEK